ncbi:MAG TPA: hypothetical protein VGN52_03190 [Burkholderiales bacterium]
MEHNRSSFTGPRPARQGRTRRHLTDEQLEALAVAFGSHLIRNAPPQRALGALLSNRNVKITAE